MNIATTLESSLQQLASQHTARTLGDRSSYLGASDIGGCPRRVILDKLNPPQHDLATLLRFQRGHMAEDIIARAFTAAGYTNFEQQVEVFPNSDSPIRAHLDFVFTSEKNHLKSILEVKSTTGIPSEPYSSWESQLHLQMGALAETFDSYQVKGAILALDLSSGEIGFFNGYTPDEALYRGLIERADGIWNTCTLLQQQEMDPEPEMKMEVSPLCSFCSHLTSCPRFAAEEVPQMRSFVDNLQQLQGEEKQLKGDIKKLKDRFLTIVNEKGTISTGNCILRKAVRSRKSLDMERLEQFLADHGTSLSEYQTSSSYSFLEVRKVKQPAEAVAA